MKQSTKKPDRGMIMVWVTIAVAIVVGAIDMIDLVVNGINITHWIPFLIPTVLLIAAATSWQFNRHFRGLSSIFGWLAAEPRYPDYRKGRRGGLHRDE